MFSDTWGISLRHLPHCSLSQQRGWLLHQLGSLAVQSCTEACVTPCFMLRRSTTKFEIPSLRDFLILSFGKPCLCFQQLSTACLFMGRAVISSCQRDFDSVPSLLPGLGFCLCFSFFSFKQVSPSNSFNSGAKLESLGILAYLCGPRAEGGISFEVRT